MRFYLKRIVFKNLLILPLFLIILIIFQFNEFGNHDKNHLINEENDYIENLVYSSNVDVFHMVEGKLEGINHVPTNPYEFIFISNCSEICNNPIKLIFLVKTATNNFERRNLIRHLWGSSKTFKNVRTIFLVGENDEDNSNLEKEFKEFHDIVQGNFKDSYYNLTLKTMMGLQWANEFCLKNTEFFMFVDDDFYVSTKNILEFLENPFLYPGTEKNENIKKFDTDTFSFYAGNVYVDTKPIRTEIGKWFISFEEYPYDKYPPYAAGTYILNRNAIKRIYFASFFLQPIPFEDAYIGILAYNVKISPISNKKNFEMLGANYTFERYKDILAVAGYGDIDKLFNIWNEHTIAESNIFNSNN